MYLPPQSYYKFSKMKKVYPDEWAWWMMNDGINHIWFLES